MESIDRDTQGRLKGRFSRLGIAFHAGKVTLANVRGLVLSGEWRSLFYRLRMKWKQVDLGYVSVEDLGSTEDRALFHGSSGGPHLDSLLKTLLISPSDQALDLGCGKAGAILTMAKYPFSCVDGVEISEKLIRVAQENLHRMKVGKSNLFHADAAEFTDLDRYTFFYMYYPFPRVVMKDVLENLAQSLQRRKRTVTLIYNNAVDHDLVLATGFRVETEFTHFRTPCPGYVYRSVE